MPPAVGTDERCSSARQDIRRLFVFDEARPGQRFFPVDKIRDYLQRSRAIWILECPCSKCKRDWAAFRRNRPPLEFLDQIVGPENEPKAAHDASKTAFSLFALLIYIEHPMLIIGFLMAQYCDTFFEKRTPSSFSTDRLREYCLDWADREGPTEFEPFVADFSQALPQFAIPRMNSGVYFRYSADTILPFMNEQKIGKLDRETGQIQSEGANGHVYAFDIYEEYQNFPDAKHCKHFARKELASSSEFAFHLENHNLDVAKTLKHPHIVRMLKAYKHGNTFNLIFPLAKSNLDHLLRDPTLDCNEPVQGPVESWSAWKQLLGISEALQIIGGPKGSDTIFGQESSVPDHQFHGVHFDLKPANILIDDESNWIISDFGQSTFRAANGSSSRVPNRGGTEAYAPPEIDKLDTRFSRRYDIWSLGCIMLEVMSFVLLGYDGLVGSSEIKGLDQVRSTLTTRTGITDSRFFCEESDTLQPSPQSKYVVKPDILKFIEGLKTAPCLESQSKSQTFVGKMLSLIVEMLEPDAEKRIEIGEVIRTLKSAIEESNATEQSLEMLPGPNEHAIGQAELGRINLWHWRHGAWKDASLRVFEDEQLNIRTCTFGKNLNPSEDHMIRSNTMLVPRYAFRDRRPSNASEGAICFSYFTEDGPQVYPGLIFSFSEAHAQDTLVVQTLLTGQKVEASYGLKNLKYRRHKSLGSRFSHLIGGSEETEDSDIDLGPCKVQLWLEMPQVKQEQHLQNNLLSTNERSPRPVRKQIHEQAGYREVPPRRMVIFVHRTRRLISIAMDRNWHEVDPTTTDSMALKFSPTKPSNDPSFSVSVVSPPNPQNPESFPGIPLSNRLLRKREVDTYKEFDSVMLTFRAEDERNKFSSKYLQMKTDWHAATKQLEKQPGYTPVATWRRERLASVPAGSTSLPETRTKSWNPFKSTRNGNIIEGFDPKEQNNIEHTQRSAKHRRPGAHRGGGRSGSRANFMVNTASTSTASPRSSTPRNSNE